MASRRTHDIERDVGHPSRDVEFLAGSLSKLVAKVVGVLEDAAFVLADGGLVEGGVPHHPLLSVMNGLLAYLLDGGEGLCHIVPFALAESGAWSVDDVDHVSVGDGKHVRSNPHVWAVLLMLR
jgi:hypothetical protein